MLVPLIRVLILYALVIASVRFMGKRQVGEMQPSELVTTILVSAVASVPVQDPDIPLSHGLVPILALVCCEVLLSGAALKSVRLRRILSGSPVPVIRAGRLLEGNLKKLRMSAEDLLEDLRLAGAWDPAQVEAAQLETNGKLSLSLKADKAPLYRVIVADGAILRDNLASAGRDEPWLEAQLQQAGGAGNIFLLLAAPDGSSLLQKKEGL